MAVKRAEKLECACGSSNMTSILELTRHPGQGFTTKVVGYACLNCHVQLDLEREQKLSELKRRQKELAEVQAELEELESQPI